MQLMYMHYVLETQMTSRREWNAERAEMDPHEVEVIGGTKFGSIRSHASGRVHRLQLVGRPPK